MFLGLWFRWHRAYPVAAFLLRVVRGQQLLTVYKLVSQPIPLELAGGEVGAERGDLLRELVAMAEYAVRSATHEVFAGHGFTVVGIGKRFFFTA